MSDRHCESCRHRKNGECKEQKSKLDLISRQDALDRLETYFDYIKRIDKRGHKRIKPIEFDVKGIVNTLPSADRPKGEWIDFIGADLGIDGQWLRDDGKTVFVKCDQCGELFIRNFMRKWNFCPNCGADMRGEAE